MGADNKFVRQIQLPEVGFTGQLAIGRTALTLAAGAPPKCAEFAELYGQAAGLDTSRVDQVSVSLPENLLGAFRHASSRDVGLGAAYALRSILDALGVPLDPSKSL